MKEYTIPVVNTTKHSLGMVAYIIFSFVCIGVFAVLIQHLSQEKGIVLLLTALLIFGIIGYFLNKKLLKTKNIHIEINDNKLRLKEQYIGIKWDDIEWHRNDDNGMVDVITIKSSKQKAQIAFKKKSPDQEQWLAFKTDYSQKIEQYAPNTRNYYDSKIWDIVLYCVYASYILIPATLYYFGFLIPKVIPQLFIYVGATIPLILAVYTNRKKKK